MRRPAIAIAVVVIVASVLFLWLKRGNSNRPERRDADTTSAAKATGDTRSPGSATPPTRAKRRPPAKGVRRMAATAERDHLLRAIRAAQRARAERAARGPGRETGDDRTRPSLPPTKGSLDKQYIQSVVRGAIDLLKECYTLARDSAPEAEGKVVVEFTILGEEDVGGLVESAKIISDNALSTHSTMAECVTQTMLSLEYPPPSGGGKVTVRYPFIFRQDRNRAPKPD